MRSPFYRLLISANCEELLYSYKSVYYLLLAEWERAQGTRVSRTNKQRAEYIQVSFKLLKVRVSGWEIQLSNKKMEYNFTLFMIFRRLNVLLLENEFESHNDIDTARYEVFSYLTS